MWTWLQHESGVPLVDLLRITWLTKPTNQPASQPINQSVNQPISQPPSHPTNQLTNNTNCLLYIKDG